MQPVKDWLTDLRIRASYGVNGTLPSDYFGYMGLSSISWWLLGATWYFKCPKLQILDLKWETNYNMNIGLDFGLLGSSELHDWNIIPVQLKTY